MKYETINPKVKIVGFGPFVKLEDGKTITPDEFVYGASRITYQGMKALDELIAEKEGDKDIREKMIKSLIKSAGSGHASMATTPGFWCILEGTSSKLVDSIFTGARFSSSLMPSGRRVPIAKENIVIPKGILEAGEKATDIYIRTSEKNIEVYEELQKRGVSTQEASKIVQYGHFGGGFMFMPLETLMSDSKMFKRDPDAIPAEGHEIISQLEKFVHENGMEIVYEARKEAPREGCPNPNIFHNRKNWASNPYFILGKDVNIISARDNGDAERNKKITDYLNLREKIFSKHELIENEGERLLEELQEVVSDNNNSVEVTTFVHTPWRVFGEVKRHRTLPQIAESIYLAVEQAKSFVEKDNFEKAVSIPNKVKDNIENLDMWKKTFANSLSAYENLLEEGVKKSDAIAVIPRGLKLGVIKTFDFYNLTTGYMSLRLCSTAEPEMRAITEKERELIIEDSRIKLDVKFLIAPKCHYTGFCHEADFSKCCGKVKREVGNYDEELHNNVAKTREQKIRTAINN